MIISYKHNFIFLKTRKSGSSSIQYALAAVCGSNDIIVGDDTIQGTNVDTNIQHSFTRDSHVSVRQLKLAMTQEKWASFFKFAFVRNPWDLVVSRYHWEKKGIGCSISNFREWLPDYVNPQFNELELNSQSNILQPIWESGGGYIKDLQSQFVLDQGQIVLQFIGKYENLQEDFDAVSKMLKIETPQLPRLKAGFRKPISYRDYYDERSRRFVEDAFATDIAILGYEF